MLLQSTPLTTAYPISTATGTPHLPGGLAPTPTSMAIHTSSPTSTPMEIRVIVESATAIPAYHDPRENLEPGIYLTYWQGGALHIRTIESSSDISIMAEVGEGRNSMISPDGNQMAFVNQIGQIMIYNFTSGEVVVFSRPPGIEWVFDVDWSPDGQMLIYSGTNSLLPDLQGEYSIYITSIDTLVTERITPWPGQYLQPAWSPDGQWIVFNTGYRPRPSLYLLDTQCIAEHFNCGTDFVFVIEEGWGAEWAPDSQWLVYECIENGAGMCIIDIENPHPYQIFTSMENQSLGNLYWSPDGQFIYFTVYSGYDLENERVHSDIFLISIEEGEAINLTNTPTEDEIAASWMVID